MSGLVVDGPRPAVEMVTSLTCRLTDAEFRVLMLMALDSYDGVTAAPGYDNLARWSGLLRSSVGAALARLCEPTKDRPALLRRVGRRQRQTVFAFTRPVTPDTWAHVSSGHAGQVVSSGHAGHVDGDTPVDASGHAGHTLPITTRVVTSQTEANRASEQNQPPVESQVDWATGGQDREAESRGTSSSRPSSEPSHAARAAVPERHPVASPEPGTSPGGEVRHMHIYAVPGERHAVIRLSGGEGRQWFHDRGYRPMWSRPQRGHQIRQEHLADIAAMASREGWHVHEHATKPTT